MDECLFFEYAGASREKEGSQTPMFTGLIEEVGQVAAIDTTDEGSRLTVSAQMVLDGVRLGDSIAVDGVCTTVVEFTGDSFAIEASPETLSKTTFGQLRPGSRVNLERPLTPVSRLGGHFVTGHVDGTAVLISREQEGISQVCHFRLLDETLAPLLVPKGSVAVNGISLTVNMVKNLVFSVALIPHTLAHTNIGDCQLDSVVNIETDLLGKYVQRLLETGGENPEAGRSRIHTGIWFNLEKAPEERLR